MKKAATTLQSLIASSLGLPGMQDLLAQEAPEDGVSVQFTYYDEEPLPTGKLAFGSPDRYKINSQQLRWVKNLDDNYSLSVEFLHEAMSGSSPWYVIPTFDEGPLQAMTGATIRDKRDQLNASVRWKNEGYEHTAGLGYSIEDDYSAIFGSYAGEKESTDGRSTVSWGWSFSADDIEPTDALDYGRVLEAKRNSFSISAGFTQVLNKNAVIQTGLALTREAGFLSDPYKAVWVDGFVRNDSRPDSRLMWSWTTKFRQYMERSKAALHLDYRYFIDDWGIHSNTLDASWHQPLGHDWELAPGVRYYTQNSPDFYGPVFFIQPTDAYWSSDYRLATYGSLSYQLNTVLRKETWSLSLGAEYYASKEDLALVGTPQDTPALVDFWRLTVRFTIEL
jgi:Protein of unknown function (DUF3570)